MLLHKVDVLLQPRAPLVGRHREGGIELFDNVLEVERVNAHAAIEHVRAADKLGEHDDTVLPKHTLGEHVLERQQIEPITRGAIEVDVREAEERKPVVHRPAVVALHLEVLDARVTVAAADAPHSLDALGGDNG